MIKNFFVSSFSDLTFRNSSLLILILFTGCNRFLVNLESTPQVQVEPLLPLEIDWRYNARAGFGPDAPLIIGHNVIVSTRRGDAHIIDLESGKRVGRKSFGDAINGSVALIDSTLVVPLVQGRRVLAAYDVIHGDMLWRIRGAPIEVGIAPVGGEGGIFVNTDGTVQRFDIRNGQIAWTYQLNGQRRVYARPLIGNQKVIIAVDNGEVIALSLYDGRVLWTLDVGAPVYVTPETNHDKLIVSTTQGRLVALNMESGAIQWTMDLNDQTLRLSTAAIDDDLAVIGGSDGALRAVELETGKILWEVQCPDALVAQPLIVSDVVYTGSMGNYFYAFNRHNGELLQTIELSGRVKSRIGKAGHGLIILSEPRYVIKLSNLNLGDEI